jgi:hypothetical protein
MKKLLGIIFILSLLFVGQVYAASLQWTASTGAAGYQVSYKTLAATTYTVVDVGNVVQWTIPTTLVKGTRYEFFVNVYAGTPKSYSGDSDHIRWTMPRDPVIIELPEGPNTIILNIP